MENITQKPVYYVFCGIDGVLWDLDSGFLIHGPYLSAIDSPVLKPESVQALNLLLKSLEKEFDTRLIITSKKRRDLSFCASYLSHNHLDYDKPLFATRFTEGLRGEKIIDFMQQDNQDPMQATSLGDRLFEIIGRQKANGTFSNYVVIEDNQKVIKKHIPAERTIKTDLKHGALSTPQVVAYLMNNNLCIDDAYFNKIANAKQFEA